ncbi:MAG: prenyltransferase/squalene oxidase repeat-containing protein [Vicinamibacteraceae bacterium]
MTKVVAISDRRAAGSGTRPASADWHDVVRATLLRERNADGHWEGCLSASALSTATAVIALATATARRHDSGVVADAGDPGIYPSNDSGVVGLIARGAAWLAAHGNADGGWGDTPQSRSNISTTALAWAALHVAPSTPAIAMAELAAATWLTHAAGGVDAASLRRALDVRYGKDRTFSVPILTALTVAGRLGAHGWRHVAQLPFELAAAPHQAFAWLRLPVVSYALPALIAIGQARHVNRPTRNPITRAVRALTRRATLAKLRTIQPTTGGFLEATPLTSFVVMSLAAAGEAGHEVARHGLTFLAHSVREDGSWPIDTNLATWATTLSVEALHAGGTVPTALDDDARARLLEWLLGQQYRVEHPYTHAAPGGWAWTDLPGGVPDADDTAGALLALSHLVGPAGSAPDDARIPDAAAAGVRWLLDLQNRDGGMPTFCRGWTGLPFDRSGPELTAHAVRAWCVWRPHLPAPLAVRVDRGLIDAARYLSRVQHGDGAFEPLWFGNEAAPHEANLTYGTARVLPALDALDDAHVAGAAGMAARAARWIAASQRPDGGWSGCVGSTSGASGDLPASIEETAQAVAALATHAARDRAADLVPVRRGLAWLRAATDDGRRFPAAPIGLYFARLWYSEALYPLIFTVAAIQAAERVLGRDGAR